MLYRGVVIIFSFILFITLLFTILCRDASNFNGIDPKLDKNIFYALFNRLYFTLTTLTTIGYGDISASSILAKSIVIFVILFIVVFVLKVLDNLITTYDQKIKNIIPDIKSNIQNILHKNTNTKDEKNDHRNNEINVD